MVVQSSFELRNVASAFGSGMRDRVSSEENFAKRENSFRRPLVTAFARSPSKSQKNKNGVFAPNSSPIKSSGGAGERSRIEMAALNACGSAASRILSPNARFPI